MTSRKRLAIALGIGLLTSFASLSAAQAQYGYPPPPPRPRGMYRGGLTFGGSLGGGLIEGPNCFSVCGGGLMLEGHLGGMLNPRLALMGTVWLGDHFFDDANAGTGQTFNTFWTLNLQYWVNDIIWINGGIGLARLQIFLDQDLSGLPYDDETGGAITGAAGVDIVQSYNWALDLQVRAGHAFYNGGDLNNLAFMVGLSWY
jgi:hypothetical protein